MNIFIASSSESLNYAKALKSLLGKSTKHSVTVWNEAPFTLGETIIESLEKIKSMYDYAVFLFHPDDKISFRTEKMTAVRDNVIFEFGLFVGTLGIKKCFAVVPGNIEIKQPTDLAGVITSRYNFNAKEKTAEKTLKKSADEILKAINGKKSLYKSEKMIRGDFRDSIVDATVNVDLIDSELHDEWRQTFQKSSKVQEELLYWDHQTANKWLEYEKYSANSYALINKMGNKVEKIVRDSFDLISLGPGSGKKDVAFLSSSITRDKIHWYYPIDISSHLLFHAMKNVTDEFDHSYLKVKGIRANFNTLQKLQYVYRYTNKMNIFTLFGNTLGNYNEYELIDRISNSMLTDDLLVVEVNNIVSYNESLKTKYKNKNYVEFILEPLRSLGIGVKAENLRFEEDKENRSLVENSKRISANYYPEKKKGTNGKTSKINITYSTHYPEKELIRYFKGHDLDYIHKEVDSKAIVLLFKKRGT